MSTNFSSLLDSFLSMLFPERDKEKTVKLLSVEDISILPRPHEELPYITSLFSYKDKKVQALIWELKYHRNTKALSVVGKLLAETIIEDLSEKSLFENWAGKILLVPIPMTAKHLRERKFSQTESLCKEILKYLPAGTMYAPHALAKIRETEKQSRTTSRTARLHNLRGAFSADEKIVRGKYIIVVDDVTTTGATISEATRALKEAGAKAVIGFTVAH